MTDRCPRCPSDDFSIDPRYPWLGRLPLRCRRCGAVVRWLEFRTLPPADSGLLQPPIAAAGAKSPEANIPSY